jgi:DNA-binding NtrC family response regulator
MTQKKILAIDDERIVLESVRRILSEENCSVDTTLHAKEGIQWATQRPYDLVLTDVRMPDLSGKVVLREIKRLKPTLPVVIVSGYATVSSAIQCMRMGAAHVLEKPFTPEELIQVVRTVLEQASQAVPEEQGMIHDQEIRKILDRAAREPGFARDLHAREADALEEYHLTAAEKLALVTSDVEWLEQYMGALEPKHKKLFEAR